ncbi:MAG TPA: argininosuccinate lyase, partial [Pseudonocardiaceae bacterium]|nr:argininosuccinate lyase [Pseudonocardiaceae bacterium]
GIPGMKITGEMIDKAAREYTGQPWGLAGANLSEVLDPWQIVLSRQAQGGAAPAAVHSMIENLRASVDELDAAVGERNAAYDRAERALLAKARAAADQESES